MLVYPSRAPTAGFPTQEKWRRVLLAGGTQESASSRAHEPRLPLPGDGPYLPEASQCDDAEDSPGAAAIPMSQGCGSADSCQKGTFCSA